ncbi:carboxymuconolactone decarboxylase family protein [Rhizobium vallis]|nr:carboxymuconolactone decarboxylase family protein [Rhizobium vallis]
MNFEIHNTDTAPEGSKAALNGLKAAFGFVPNIAGAMAASPVLVNCLAALFQNVHGGSFTERQIQILLLTNAVTNGAEWAVGFHSFLAGEQGVAPRDVEAIRYGYLPSDPSDAALSRFARALIQARGQVAPEDAEQFLKAGFDRNRLLEVIAVVAASTITNYTAGVTHPPLEAPFDAHAWNKN